VLFIDYRYKPNELFKRMKVSTFVQLVSDCILASVQLLSSVVCSRLISKAHLYIYVDRPQYREQCSSLVICDADRTGQHRYLLHFDCIHSSLITLGDSSIIVVHSVYRVTFVLVHSPLFHTLTLRKPYNVLSPYNLLCSH